MKTGLKIISIVMVVAVVAMFSCQKEKTSTEPEAASVPYEGAPEIKSEFEPKVIATVQSEHSEMQFIQVVDQQVVILERLSAESSKIGKKGVLESYQGSSAFDFYVKITESDVIVPEIIANTGDPSVVASSNRKIDATNSLVNLMSDNFVAPRACSNLSSTSFANGYCDLPVTSNSNNIEFCDNGVWSTLIRNSVFASEWEKVNQALCRTEVRCGKVDLKAYYWDPTVWPTGAWREYFSSEMFDGVSGFWTDWINKEYMQVKRTKTSGNGFRAFTRFVD